jgi:hypothetical protein
MLRLTRKVEALVRVLATFPFSGAENVARPKWKVHCLVEETDRGWYGTVRDFFFLFPKDRNF